MTSYRCYTLIKALVEGARKQMIHSVSQIAAARMWWLTMGLYNIHR